MPCEFYKRPILLPGFTDSKNPKRVFTFAGIWDHTVLCSGLIAGSVSGSTFGDVHNTFCSAGA